MSLININHISHIKDSKLNQNNQINKQGVTEGEEACFCYFLFDLEGLGPLPTYPLVGSKPMQFTLKNLFGGLG